MKIVGLDQVQKAPVTMEGAHGITKQVPLSRNDGAESAFVMICAVPMEYEQRVEPWGAEAASIPCPGCHSTLDSVCAKVPLHTLTSGLLKWM